MTEQQTWIDLAKFADAIRRGLIVAFENGETTLTCKEPCCLFTAETISRKGGIREIIEPPQKKVRPLNAEEWRDVAGCVICPLPPVGAVCIIAYGHNPEDAKYFADQRATCHPPGNSKDVRKLWVEE